MGTRRTDKKLRLATTNVLAKISAVLPEDLRQQLEFSGLLIGPVKTTVENDDEQEALITTLLDQLDLTKNKKLGISISFWLLAITDHDMQLNAMKSPINN